MISSFSTFSLFEGKLERATYCFQFLKGEKDAAAVRITLTKGVISKKHSKSVKLHGCHSVGQLRG